MNELIDQIGNIGYGRVTIMKRYEAYIMFLVYLDTWAVVVFMGIRLKRDENRYEL